jgi:hypothetical protein
MVRHFALIWRYDLEQFPSNEARLEQLAHEVRTKLEPSHGQRPGRPTHPDWVLQRKVSMDEETFRSLEELAATLSTSQRKVTAMQIAALLLQQAVAQCARDTEQRV